MGVFVDMRGMAAVLKIRYGQSIGTSFLVAIDKRSFLFTAKHIVQDFRPGDKVALFQENTWRTLEVIKHKFCEKGNDVAVLLISASQESGLNETDMSANLVMGQDIAYCGFPLRLQMPDHDDSFGMPMPIMKSGIFSGVNELENRAEFLFDTHNNKGFSGGPIFVVDHKDKKTKIAAIVSGYKYDDPIPVLTRDENSEFVETAEYWVRPNSGFMVGCSVAIAVDIARQMV
ncbi:MAG: trypsin-like peptidase domain-containing protein [Alphaproteobacteria bacterium]|nr:trypsin-like peptidase domain-containing protein [Alphaproteobacteria bacterium]